MKNSIKYILILFLVLCSFSLTACGEHNCEKDGHNYINYECTICGDKLDTTGWSEGLEIVDGVVKGIGTCEDTVIVIPSYTAEGTKITQIDKKAFAYCKNITSITIPETVTSIGLDVFELCKKLTTIKVDSNNPTYDSRENCNAIIETATNTLIAACNNSAIPNTVKIIGEGAFGYCQMITSLIIPDSVTTIGYGAFRRCDNLESITIPNSVTIIDKYAFNGCAKLSSITLPENISTIGNFAFDNCDSLTSIIIPASVTSIGENPFDGCISLTSITVDSNNSKYDSRYNCNAIIETATNTLISGCMSSTIPNTITNIEENAFGWCPGLTSITIPSSVTYISDEAFGYCPGLTSIKVDSENTKYDSRNNCNAIIETATNTLFKGCKNTKIPNSVTIIGADAFCYCNDLVSITIPSSITTIGAHSFYGCESLLSVTIPNSVTIIEEDAFGSCDSLTTVVLPDSLTSIGEAAFWACSELSSINIPNSITKIEDDTFGNCYEMRSLIIPNSITSIGGECFCGFNGDITYQGTIAQWNAIDKSDDWNYGFDLSIVCTDGTINSNE